MYNYGWEFVREASGNQGRSVHSGHLRAGELEGPASAQPEPVGSSVEQGGRPGLTGGLLGWVCPGRWRKWRCGCWCPKATATKAGHTWEARGSSKWDHFLPPLIIPYRLQAHWFVPPTSQVGQGSVPASICWPTHQSSTDTPRTAFLIS